MKYRITLTADIEKPEVGDIYSAVGICGRSGFWSAPIVKVTDKAIYLHNDSHRRSKHKKLKISLKEYFHNKLSYDVDNILKKFKITPLP